MKNFKRKITLVALSAMAGLALTGAGCVSQATGLNVPPSQALARATTPLQVSPLASPRWPSTTELDTYLKTW